MASSALTASMVVCRAAPSNDDELAMSGRLSMVYCNRASIRRGSLFSRAAKKPAANVAPSVVEKVAELMTPAAICGIRAAMKRLSIVVLLVAFRRESTPPVIGDSTHGRQLVQQYGCTSCHDIPNVSGPRGMVGPPLTHVASRELIAGK